MCIEIYERISPLAAIDFAHSILEIKVCFGFFFFMNLSKVSTLQQISGSNCYVQRQYSSDTREAKTNTPSIVNAATEQT